MEQDDYTESHHRPLWANSRDKQSKKPHPGHCFKGGEVCASVQTVGQQQLPRLRSAGTDSWPLVVEFFLVSKSNKRTAGAPVIQHEGDVFLLLAAIGVANALRIGNW
ncbi:hypothetical protein DAPPUDRAFT_95241 [Daphnia pulex]|uniref:Uncharacterized protein n=1 Tax=Daphnia pulex TaxID=6669 RepID=E9FV23_DAPPU|nr:hypothetical protein DAPPUDRAFT_95241 [Daphnia pulex]|eukprot:EFX88479.1 hypothetical protein DAPPUDRAFT_95241 [Daphnia pulex]